MTVKQKHGLSIRLTDDPTVFALEGGARAGDGSTRAAVIGRRPAAVTV